MRIYTPETLPERLRERVCDIWNEGREFFELEDEAENTRLVINEALDISLSRVYYSLAFSQGDGACFNGTIPLASVAANADRLLEYWPTAYEYLRDDLDECKRVQALLNLRNWPDATLIATHDNSHYYHSGCMDFTLFAGDYDPAEWFYYELRETETGEEVSDRWAEAEKLADEYEELVGPVLEDFATTLADFFYDHLRDELEHLQSWEYISGVLDGNDLKIIYNPETDKLEIGQPQ